MTDTFTWAARVDASEDLTVATLSAQFGDGYKQVAGSGMNAAVESWSLTCNGSRAEMVAIRAFLKSHITTAFWWTNAWGDRQLYRVKSDSISTKFIHGELAEISFKFEQAFAP